MLAPTAAVRRDGCLFRVVYQIWFRYLYNRSERTLAFD